jgi:hypothetical protein
VLAEEAVSSRPRAAHQRRRGRPGGRPNRQRAPQVRSHARAPAPDAPGAPLRRDADDLSSRRSRVPINPRTSSVSRRGLVE